MYFDSTPLGHAKSGHASRAFVLHFGGFFCLFLGGFVSGDLSPFEEFRKLIWSSWNLRQVFDLRIFTCMHSLLGNQVLILCLLTCLVFALSIVFVVFNLPFDHVLNSVLAPYLINLCPIETPPKIPSISLIEAHHRDSHSIFHVMTVHTTHLIV